MLIINADDFGYDSNTNAAIAQCFKMGLCSSTSIMPNMPGFEEALALVDKFRLTLHTGLHFVLTEGIPLTIPIKDCERFCDKNGHFHYSRKSHAWRLTKKEKRALEIEVRAQIAICRKAGLPLTHMDTHNHAHEDWGILTCLIPTVISEGIPFVRITRTSTHSSNMTSIYRFVVNRRLRSFKLARTKYFGVPDNLRSVWRKQKIRDSEGLSWEIMLHPGLGANGELVDTWLKKPLNKLLEGLPGIENAVSFLGKKYVR